jgi:hypothetical protein
MLCGDGETAYEVVKESHVIGYLCYGAVFTWSDTEDTDEFLSAGITTIGFLKDDGILTLCYGADEVLCADLLIGKPDLIGLIDYHST